MKRLTAADKVLLRKLAAHLALDPLGEGTQDRDSEVRLFLSRDEARTAARLLLTKVAPEDGDDVRRETVGAHVRLTRVLAGATGNKRAAARAATDIEPLDIVSHAAGIASASAKVAKQNRQRIDYIAREASRKARPK
jgi:hypothetical protein